MKPLFALASLAAAASACAQLELGTPFADRCVLQRDRLVVKSAKAPNPVKVRYMARPRQAGTLYNEASLPLGAFEAQAE